MLDFTGNISAPTASVTTEKCVFKSVVYNPGAMCILAGINFFLLEQYLTRPRIYAHSIENHPTGNHDAYNLTKMVYNQGWIYMRTKKGMYGLKQAGIIANQELVKNMAPFGYHPVKHTPGLWAHDNQNTIFSLVVDDFCFQYSSMKDSNPTSLR